MLIFVIRALVRTTGELGDGQTDRGAGEQITATHCEGDREPVAVEQCRGERNDPGADGDAEHGTDSGRDHSVDRPLQREGPQDGSPLQADGSHRSEFDGPFTGQHHEEIDHEQYAGDDAESADRSEQFRHR